MQYGLIAFVSGKIDADQFVELNELIGGLDTDGQFSNVRMQASERDVERAYRSGAVQTGEGGLPETPIIDWRRYGQHT